VATHWQLVRGLNAGNAGKSVKDNTFYPLDMTNMSAGVSQTKDCLELSGKIQLFSHQICSADVLKMKTTGPFPLR